MLQVNTNLHEYVEYVSDRHIWDWDETTVAIVDYEITAKFFGCKIVDAASSIGHITQNEALDGLLFCATEFIDDIADNRSVN